ncbi:monocarboxylate transporter 9 [Dermacentor silvarum]|uniref:monocarboxylate transporter 9 n=1 Tax=Dermacentor silvarum TaxID=543639 RepID=UPI001898AB06|nr:monocarboxylate transporter 9 [Dermacentor silvarum]
MEQLFSQLCWVSLVALGKESSSTAASSVLPDYFSSRRGLALGVVMTGAPAASFIFPAIFDYVLEEYGLRGTLLLTGACMLNIPAFGVLLRDRLKTSVEETCRQWDASSIHRKIKAAVELQNTSHTKTKFGELPYPKA